MSNQNIAIIGASGGLGSAFVKLFSSDPTNTVHAFSRSEINIHSTNVHLGKIDYSSEDSIKKAANKYNSDNPLNLIIVTTGILHEQGLKPEKSLRDLNTENFERIFLVNTIGPALIAKHFLPKMQRNEHSVFAVLSARVGSIADNQLGGWYAYRASKAALNMLIKTISIEMSRRQLKTVVVGLHPGTVATNLSKPFQRNVPDNKLFCPDYSAKQLASVLKGLSQKDSGKIFAWDNKEVPY